MSKHKKNVWGESVKSGYGAWTFDADTLLGPLERVGPENLEFFGPKWRSLRALPFQIHYLGKWEGGWALEISTFWAPNGTSLTTRCHFRAQKSLDFQDPPLIMALVMDMAFIKIITFRAI
jgi:hypothetical protein